MRFTGLFIRSACFFVKCLANCGISSGRCRNAGTAMTYGEAYQRLFPSVVGELG